MNTIFFFHENCFDGYAAYVAARYYFENNGFTATDLSLAKGRTDVSKLEKMNPVVQGMAVLCNYQEGVPKDTVIFCPIQYYNKIDFSKFNNTDHFIFADFTPRKEQLLEIRECQRPARITIIDHHDTAYRNTLQYITKQNFPEVEVVYSSGTSGAELTWNHFFKQEKVPPLISYVGDRDTYNWNYPQTRAVTTYLGLIGINVDESTYTKWVNLLWLHKNPKLYDDVISLGTTLWKQHEKTINSIASTAKTVKVTISGPGQLGIFYVPMVFCPHMFASDVCDVLNKDQAFAISVTLDKGQYRYSLRSNKNYANSRLVNDLCETYGGGGHERAAGFRLENFIDEFIFDIN